MKKSIFYRSKHFSYFVLFYILLLVLLGTVDLTLNNGMYFSPIFVGVFIVLFVFAFLKTVYRYEFDDKKIIRGFILKRTIYLKDVDQIQSIKNGVVLFNGKKKLIVKLLAYDINRDNYEVLIKTISKNIPSGIDIDKDSQKLLEIGVDRFINSWDGNPNLGKRIAVYSIGVGFILIAGIFTIIIDFSNIPETSKLILCLYTIDTIIFSILYLYTIYLVVKLQKINNRLRQMVLFKDVLPIILYMITKWAIYSFRNTVNTTIIAIFFLTVILGVSITVSIILKLHRLKYNRKTKKELLPPPPVITPNKTKHEEYTRELSDREKYWAQTLISNQVIGREILINQLDSSLVTTSYSDESITIRFTVDAEVDRFPYRKIEPIDMAVHQEDGTTIVMLLYLFDGYIREMQIFNTELTKISIDFTLDMIGTRATKKVLH